jgi:hypothetical protein
VTVAELLHRLECVRAVRNGWIARCPAHQDRSPSLSISEGRDGRVLLKCFAGCTLEAICAVLKIRVSELFASPGEKPKAVPCAVRERAENAAWRIADELSRLRRYYMDALHRAGRLQARIGSQIAVAQTESESESGWEQLSRLAPAGTFFLAAYTHINELEPAELMHFALASPAERRAAILGETELANANAA